ncbi:DNA alkylation repair protein [Candidatus Saccharibacteria bacterium]|nr:DNA alkylation repair protein [Candidatus Saccharibacteria bacterium]
MTYKEIRLELTKNIDDDYRVFVQKANPTSRPILGVRIPVVREIAKRVPREDFTRILKVEPISQEELMFRGMLIARMPYEEMLKNLDSQVDLIDDWCSCDTFCSSLRPLIKKHKGEFLEQKIDPFLNSKNEFAVRVGLVLLLGNYVTPDYLPVIFDRIEILNNREEYYIKMGIAWLLAECFIKFPDETLGYLQVSNLNKWTFNKAISKICDSLRVEGDMKNYLRTLRKS